MNLMNLFCLLCFTFLDGWKSCRDGERLERGKTQLLRWPRQDFTNREFKILRRRQLRKRRLKSEFALFQPLSRLLKLVHRLLCQMQGHSFWAEFLRIIFKFRKRKKVKPESLIKLEIGHFPVVVVQWRQRNVHKSVIHVQSCCFPYSTYCFFDVLVVVTVVASLSPLMSRWWDRKVFFSIILPRVNTSYLNSSAFHVLEPAVGVSQRQFPVEQERDR